MAAKEQSAVDQQEAIIEQVRIQIETYFAPQNIENDYNLKRKMTTDGYIDIDLLLGLKLIQDLASDRDILIEAIARSKILVMNTARTMVKYMPLLERNVLILRDIKSNTEKTKIYEIFNDQHCAKVVNLHSDIGDNWFVTFKTEEDCLKTFKYLQSHGAFNGQKLRVRVKAVHDTNSADASPQNKKVRQPPRDPFVQQPSPVAPPMYGPYNEYTNYYGDVNPYFISYNQPPMQQQAPMDDPQQQQPPPPPPQQQKRASGNVLKSNDQKDRSSSQMMSDKGQQRGGGGGDDVGVSKDDNDNSNNDDNEEFTTYSDYPGSFDKYTQQQFLDIYQEISASTITAPMSMRGRDSRIINEEVQRPAVIIQNEEEKKEKEQEMQAKKDGKNDKKGKNKSKNKKKNKDQQELYRGTYVVDDYGAPTQQQQPYYENEDYEYYNDAYMAGQSYYYSTNNNNNNQRNGGGRRRRRNDNYYYADYGYYYYNDGYGGGYSNNNNNQQDQGRKQRGGGGGGRRYNSRRNNNNNNNENNQGASNQKARNKWSPRSPKKYATNRGVYRSKSQTAY